MARDDWLDDQPTQENEESAISLAMQNLNFQDLESLTKLPAQPTHLNQENEESLLLAMQNLNFQDSESLTKLHKTQFYIDIKHRIERAIHKRPRLILQDGIQDGTRPVPGHGHPEYCLVKDCHTISEEEYQLVVDCISLSVDIIKEIAMITNFIHHNYSSKFPELESLVHYPVDHARVVKGVATEAVEGIATQKDSIVFYPMQRPYDTIVTLSLEAVTTTTGELPSEEELKKTIKACDQVFDLNAMKWKIVNFVESRMTRVGPNLAALVGSRIAAKLVTTAGGLSALSRMPDCTIEILGGRSELLVGYSRERPRVRYGGYVEQTPIYWTTIPSLRICVRQDLAGKVALAAQMDSVRGDPTGQTGRTMLEEIVKKVEKMHPKPPAKIFKMRMILVPMQQKSFPVPGFESGYDPIPGYNQCKKKRTSRHVLAPKASVKYKN